MNCTEARDAMLDAEPSDLHTTTESPLALHLRECRACWTLAEALASDTDLLSSRVRARSRHRTLMLAALPVAAVLVAAVTLATSRGEKPTVAVRQSNDRPANVVSVDVGVGQRATVIKTADPKTTLIWISSGSH